MSGVDKAGAFYADFGGLAQLKGAAQNQDPKAVREAARQFESLFTQMMLKSMRQATSSLPGGESMMDNDQSDMYREMFDNQLSMQLSKGKGLGLADMLVRQLTQGGADPAAAAALKMPGASSAQSPIALPAQKSALMPVPSSIKSHSPPTNAPLNPVAGMSKAAPSDNITTRDRAAAMRNYLDEMWPVKSNDAATGRAAVQDVTSVTPINSIDPRSLGNHVATGAQAKVMTEAKTPSSSAAVAKPLAATAAEFVEKMWPHAQAAARELGVDAKTLIAHAALETGWGKFVPCNPDGSCSFNLFGIKAGTRWQGNSVSVNTLEYQGGVAVKERANFRAYDSPADSFRDYAAFIKNSPRYVGAIGTGNDAAKFATALQQGGYATDPNYAAKLTATTQGVIARAAPWLKNFSDQPIIAGSSVSGAVSRGEKT